MTTHAPIAVFAYSRPEHLRKTLIGLTGCTGFDASPLTVFVDGPRTPDQAEAVAAVIEVARAVLGNGADIRPASFNQGLSRAITGGVTNLLDRHDRVIVLEDDLELAPCFLNYMNNALDRFAEDESVFQVSGYMFDVPQFFERHSAMLLPLTTTWGWATWGRAWRHFDPLATGWQRLREDRDLRRRFDLGGSYPYSWIMEQQMLQRLDSWGIRWYWSVFQAGGFGVFPPQSLVRNIGQDGSGTHGGGLWADFAGKNAALPQVVPVLPEKNVVVPEDLAAVADAIWRQNGGWLGWALTRLRKTLRV